jgi:amino acid adenylation domain-containing protein
LGHELPKYSPIVRQSTSKPIELSFGQQRLWFVSQLDSGSAAYNVPLAWRLTGRLKIDALEGSLNQVVQRHEALRTCFPVVDGRPVQVVTEQALTLTHVDLRDAGSRLKQLIDEEIRKPFDLAQDPPVRAALFRLRDDEHLFVLTVQHISSDGASMGVLLRELSHFYDAAVGGVPPNLPEPAVQCRDFTRWQQEMLTGELREKQLAYWKQQLKDVPALLSLSSYPRTAAVSFRGGIATRQLSKELSADFKQLARRHGVTTFMALLATLDVLLYRYSGQPDIVVGASMTHRTRDEVSRSIGFFANMMALRTGLGDDPTLRDLLKRVRSLALGAYAHQDVPFDMVVSEVQPERVPGRNPLFQVMLNVEEASWHDLHLAGLESVEIPVHGGTSKFDLSLSVVIRDQGFQLALEYNSDLFDAGTAQRMLGSFETLMGSAISDPGCHVSRMALLTESERSELLSRWNQTREDYPDEACVQELFEAQVQRSPDAIAVEFQGRQLSYRDLNARANQLARHLAKRGVGPEVLVGICLDPSADLLVAMLGILKAGGAYVPLDRAHPPQRRVEILSESGAQFLITHEEALKEMSLPNSTAIVRMDSDWPAIAAESGENPLLTAHASNLAYVIYTSGSTGRPKGVQIEHRGVVNFLCAMQRRPGITPADVVVAITTISFDPSVLELLLPLTVGARIVIPTWEEVTDARRLLEVLERSAPTILQATPTTWQMLLAAGWQKSPQMTALCGGEPLSRGLADQLLERCASVWNIYGPTETTVWSVVHEVDRADTGPPCIGSPIANMRMYVLDSHQQPVPLGVAGELYVGGTGMARGYLGAEQLTAGRQPRISRTRRPADEDPRPPHRARGGGVCARPISRRASGRCCCPQRWSRGHESGGLH